MTINQNRNFKQGFIGGTKRYFRFGIVGGSGIAVNQAVLWVSMEWLLVSIPETARLNYALVLAISIATISNFLLNRFWTWYERRQNDKTSTISKQFIQYVIATLLGSFIQFVLTHYLYSAQGLNLHYSLANFIAIFFASFVNFFLNDQVTFRRKTKTSQTQA